MEIPTKVGQAYFATVAQVIATMVLALVLEVGSIYRRYAPRTRVSQRRIGYVNGRFLWYFRTAVGPIVLPKPAAVGVLSLIASFGLLMTGGAFALAALAANGAVSSEVALRWSAAGAMCGATLVLYLLAVDLGLRFLALPVQRVAPPEIVEIRHALTETLLEELRAELHGGKEAWTRGRQRRAEKRDDAQAADNQR